jgi:hypothetical protein
LKQVVTVAVGLLVALAALMQTSCSKKGQDHVFVKLYTSANMVGTIEPCG